MLGFVLWACGWVVIVAGLVLLLIHGAQEQKEWERTCLAEGHVEGYCRAMPLRIVIYSTEGRER